MTVIQKKKWSGLKLKSALAEKDVTIRWLALKLTELLGDYVDQTKLYRWQANDATPDRGMVFHIAKLLDQPLDYFYVANSNNQRVQHDE